VRKQRLLAGAIVVLCGCGGNPTSNKSFPPTSPSPISPTPLRETWTAMGTVFHANYLVCGGCVVEVVDGPRAGTSTLTDNNGKFSVDVPNESPQVTLRAMTEGYRSVDEKVATRGNFNSGWVALYVVSVLPPAPLRGAYRMKLEADPIGCTVLPPSARAREYDIVINSDARRTDFWFKAETVGAAVERFDMYAGVSGNDVGVSVWHAEDESAGIVERMNADIGESFSVLAWTVVPAPYAVPFMTPLKGTLTWCPTRAAANCVVCESSGHQLTLLPR
jgi:hypothetical protein